METLALIPARGGSKSIKNKNLAVIEGKTLVSWSIYHALNARGVDRVIVSTDSEEIAQEALDNGAEVPFMRPPEYAQDSSLDLPVFQHCIDWLATNEGYRPEFIVHLRPTTPYRELGWIEECLTKAWSMQDSDAVRSVSLVEQHPYRLYELGLDGYLNPFEKEVPDAPALRRQDHPPLYHYNCVIDIVKTATITDKLSMTGSKLAAWVMSPDMVIDIDTPRDLEFAKYFMEKHMRGQPSI